MWLANTRERRSTAGNRLHKVLNETGGEDEFFQTKYGGFNEEVNDEDYKEEKEVEDVSDSDISIDENDEVISDNEDEPKKTRRGGLFTKAYKEPAKPVAKPATEPVKKKVVTRRQRNEPFDRKSSRRSTAAKSAATRERMKSRIEIEKKKRKMRRAPKQEIKLTQEELLEEAKVTEEENLKSLEKFQKMELEKKKVRFVKKVIVGPLIRYHSMGMPLIQREGSERDQGVKTCERTFITFSSDVEFRQVFNKRKPSVKTLYCPYTR